MITHRAEMNSVYQSVFYHICPETQGGGLKLNFLLSIQFVEQLWQAIFLCGFQGIRLFKMMLKYR